MKTHLGDWNPLLEGWHVCTYDDCTPECIACVELPPWYQPQFPLQAHYTLTYLTARALLDYRIASVLHLITLQHPPAHPGPQTLAKLIREARVQTRIPPAPRARRIHLGIHPVEGHSPRPGHRPLQPPRDSKSPPKPTGPSKN